MNPSVFERIYARLTTLIPGLDTAPIGSAFYAPARIAGDMSVSCSIAQEAGQAAGRSAGTNLGSRTFELEIAHDQIVNGDEQPAPWMVFRVDAENRSAELLAMEDAWRYEVAYADGGQSNPRRIPMNVFAVNWLTVMINLHLVFQPVSGLQNVAEEGAA